MILLIDNYDSFVHNLARYFRLLGCETLVVRNDATDADQVRKLAPDAVVLSPGPGRPEDAGAMVEIIRSLGTATPMLGICLGHQALAAAFGGRVSRTAPVHGRSSVVRHDGAGVFTGVASPLQVGRYHSLAVGETDLPPDFTATAWTDDGVVMAMRHESAPLVGLQFHPESILTRDGLQALKNFLAIARRSVFAAKVAPSALAPADSTAPLA